MTHYDVLPRLQTRREQASPVRLSMVALSLLLSCGAFLHTERCLAEAGCSPRPAVELTPAEQAYKDGKFESADGLYVQALESKPADADLNAGLIHTLLHEGRVDDASGRVTKLLADHPSSAPLLVALAEVQLRQGHPWLASQSLDNAAAADPCNARAHYIRSRIYRIGSMYASERAELSKAYELDPADPDIWHAWLQVVRPATEIASISEALKTTPDLDADNREKAVASMTAMRPLLTENSQTCKEVKLAGPVTLPIVASYASVKEIDAYKLRVDLPKSSVRLVVDTAASGLYISRATADANGFEHNDADPPGTVRIADLHIGPVELRDCMVGVSETPFADHGEGFIGTDVFADSMITLNFPQSRIELEPLPALPGGANNDLPGDRSASVEREGFTPVYHRKQFLLVPVTLNKKDRQLFALDTGVRLTTMTSAAAHAVSSTRLNFTNTLKTVSGASLQVYRDSFDFQFADRSFGDTGHVIEFDPTAIDENTGLGVAGLLGFNLLHGLSLQIDYRDGLVRFSSPVAGQQKMDVASNATSGTGSVAEEDASCNQYANQNADLSIHATLEGSVIVGGLDSAHLKSGQAITIRSRHDWVSPVCTLTPKSNLYGHVLSATSSKANGPSTLAVVFDKADCEGHPKQEMLLRVIGIAGGEGAKDESLHDVLPSEVAGGGRSISLLAAAQGNQSDDKLAPELAPAIVHPGIVSGLPHLKLTPEGGPRCSTLLTSDARSVRLDSGAEFIMTVQQTATP